MTWCWRNFSFLFHHSARIDGGDSNALWRMQFTGEEKQCLHDSQNDGLNEDRRVCINCWYMLYNAIYNVAESYKWEQAVDATERGLTMWIPWKKIQASANFNITIVSCPFKYNYFLRSMSSSGQIIKPAWWWDTWKRDQLIPPHSQREHLSKWKMKEEWEIIDFRQVVIFRRSSFFYEYWNWIGKKAIELSNIHLMNEIELRE